MQHADLAHPTLTHPHTGEPLRPIGYLKSGRPIWPVMGAAEGDGTEGGGKDGKTGTEGGGKDAKVFTQADLDAAIDKAAAKIRENERTKVTKELTAEAAAKGQTAEEQIAALTKQVADTQLEALRSRVQARFGISDEDAELFLTGTDKDTLEKQAARLKEQNDARNGARVPGEGGGGRPVITDEKQAVRTLFAG